MRRDQMARDLASLANEDSLFTDAVREKLGLLQKELRPLAARYDVVVANPPYMGSNNANKWLSGWMKKQYPDTYRDLCTCFVTRGFQLSTGEGYVAFITSDTCMYISSFERMRKRMISESTIVAFIDTRGTNAHPDVFDANAGWVFFNRAIPDFRGSYFKLSHPIAEKEAKYLEALANPECGWFYRRNASAFKAVPGSPIVYWASKGVGNAFKNGTAIGEIGQPRQGLATGENARFVRQWWEVSLNREWFDCPSLEKSIESKIRWFPYNKGGEYRKWYGNNDCVVNWENNGAEIRNFNDASGKQLSRPQNTQWYFHPSITWSKISSGSIAFRYKPAGHVFDVAGTSIFAEANTLSYLHGACNSSVILQIASMLSPTLNFEVGQIATYPIVFDDSKRNTVIAVVEEQRASSKADWDASETSWDFCRHPLV